MRELENYIERGVAVSKKSVLTLSDFTKELVYPPAEEAEAGGGQSLASAEKNLILKTLRESDDNRTKTAEDRKSVV